MKDTKIGVQDIDASLKYGQVFSGQAWKGIFVFLYITSGIIGAFIIATLICVPLILGEYDRNSIGFIMICTIAIMLFTILIIALKAYIGKGKHKATLWLEDAIVLEAYAKSVGQTLHVRNMIARTATAIEVSFEYDDKRCVRQSTYKDKPLYLAVYTKYADKKILIAYSPKYDEVMLIKPQSAQRIKDSNNNTK